MQEPEWADQIIKDVLFLHNRTKRPKIKWLQTNKSYSSGWAYASNYSRKYPRSRRKFKKVTPDILIRQGIKPNRYVLLHELAHWLLRANHHHDKTFWRKAWDLYFYFLSDEEIEDAKTSEFAYKGKAKEVYQEITEK